MARVTLSSIPAWLGCFQWTTGSSESRASREIHNSDLALPACRQWSLTGREHQARKRMAGVLNHTGACLLDLVLAQLVGFFYHGIYTEM